MILLPENALKTFHRFSPTFVENVAYNITRLYDLALIISFVSVEQYSLQQAFRFHLEVLRSKEIDQMSTACQSLVSIVSEGVTLLAMRSIPETACFCFTNPNNGAVHFLNNAQFSKNRSIA